METLTINVPDKKLTLVKQLLKELGVSINEAATTASQNNAPNKLTSKTIDDARNGIGLNEPIKDISSFIDSL